MGPVGDDVFPERVEKAEANFGYETRETNVCAGASPWEGEAILGQRFLVITPPEVEASHDNLRQQTQNNASSKIGTMTADSA